MIQAILLSLSIAFASPGGRQWLEVPYVVQAEAGCGAASIAMVMQYWVSQTPGLDASAADFQTIYKTLPHSKNGISGAVLARYLEKHGFSSFVFSGDLANLHHHLEKGRPLVVAIAPHGSHGPFHYAVVVGLADEAVLFHDPVRGKLIHQSSAEFQREWKETGNWSLLALPRLTQ